MSKIRTRFAPSPTGFLHIGSLRTALFDYLLAKSMGGKLILRIEDTDQKRQVKGAEEKLFEILDWLGIKFDEGPHVGGKYGPYIQSQRLDIYKKYIQELLKKQKAYYCFCSPERLEKMRQEQAKHKLPPRYNRTCRDLSKTEIKKRIGYGEKYVIRQKMPLAGGVVVHDELRGDIKFNVGDLEDHVLIKSDGWPTYQFALVVDDHLMQISHVVRGEEWIPSFPKNILLYQAFGWQPPKFYHIPLTLNKGGGKLSKRHGDVAVEDYQAEGYLPEAIINFSVLLGWSPYVGASGDKTSQVKETLSLNEMMKLFKVEDIGTSPAVFEIEKLDYFNGYYIRQKSVDELVKLCMPFLQTNLKKTQKHPPASSRKASRAGKNTKTFIKNVVALEQERLKKLSEIGELTEFFFVDKLKYDTNLLICPPSPKRLRRVKKKMSKKEVKENLIQLQEQLEKIPRENWTNDSIKDAIITFIKAKQGKVGEFLWPMRVALTGRKASPGPFEVAEVLGRDESLNRIKQAINKL